MTQTVDQQGILALLDSDPAAGILAAADLREKLAKAMGATAGAEWRAFGEWVTAGTCECTCDADPIYGHRVGCGFEPLFRLSDEAAAEHIAAEANPAHALAAVRRWKKVVDRHRPYPDPNAGTEPDEWTVCNWCGASDTADAEDAATKGRWPCPDLRETADEARAYLGGAA
jgi:hypothetical protein